MVVREIRIRRLKFYNRTNGRFSGVLINVLNHLGILLLVIIAHVPRFLDISL